MKKAYGKVLPAVLLASTFAVGACASSSEVDDLKASVNTLQRDVAGLKSDTAAARAEFGEGCPRGSFRSGRRAAGSGRSEGGCQRRHCRLRQVRPDVPEVTAQVVQRPAFRPGPSAATADHPASLLLVERLWVLSGRSMRRTSVPCDCVDGNIIVERCR